MQNETGAQGIKEPYSSTDSILKKSFKDNRPLPCESCQCLPSLKKKKKIKAAKVPGLD